MNLGDLEFKAEDFSFDNCFGDAKRIIEEACAKQANEILREKLAKAPEIEVVDGNIKHEEVHDLIFSDYRARLICIEEVGK